MAEGLVAELEKLAELKERGFLTDAEFDAEKRRLLASSTPVEANPGSRAVVSSVVSGPMAAQSPATCSNCLQPWMGGQSCQFCGQVWGLPIGIRLSSAGRRFGEYLLEGVLVVATVLIGWVIWALIVFARGQTPAKQVLKMRIVRLDTRSTARWGRTFLREVIFKSIILGFLGWLVFPYFWFLWDKDNQELWDKMAATVVVNDPHRQLARNSRV